MPTIRTPETSPALAAVLTCESRNTLLKLNDARAERMTEADALAWLSKRGFTRGEVVRHTRHRNCTETVVTDWHRTGSHVDGSFRYDRARVTVTYSI